MHLSAVAGCAPSCTTVVFARPGGGAGEEWCCQWARGHWAARSWYAGGGAIKVRGEEVLQGVALLKYSGTVLKYDYFSTPVAPSSSSVVVVVLLQYSTVLYVLRTVQRTTTTTTV